MADSPTVSALVAVYNYEQYVGLAIESALAQDYPPECLEVVVVDDGSTDGSAAVVEEFMATHPGRIRLFRQENAGYIAATNRAMAEARGELLAVLDADDLWLADKTRRSVELLQARPEVGLVFSDLSVIHAAGELTQRSFLGDRIGDASQAAFARLLVENFVTASSIVVRADLRGAFDPIPPDIPYADWWLALNVARVAQIDLIREPLALYRLHTANLTHGASGAAAVREHRKYVDFQLSTLRRFDLTELGPGELLAAWEAPGAKRQRPDHGRGLRVRRDDGDHCRASCRRRPAARRGGRGPLRRRRSRGSAEPPRRVGQRPHSPGAPDTLPRRGRARTVARRPPRPARGSAGVRGPVRRRGAARRGRSAAGFRRGLRRLRHGDAGNRRHAHIAR